MGNKKPIVFDCFSLDPVNECLWRGSTIIKLRPKAYAVITYLIGRSGQLVTKDELLSVVWPETFVTDAVLKVTIRQLREALGDDPKSPRFIETAHRRGYRFIGQIKSDIPSTTDPRRTSGNPPFLPAPRSPERNQPVVGRDGALSQIEMWLERVHRGERQIVFVTGEAGIGKTAFVDTFVRKLLGDGNIRIAIGQCLEQYGTSEAFLPLLDAIGRLCKQRPEVVDVLRVHAPMWLLQMPSLVTADERELLTRESFGSSRERMLRGIAEALEALAQREPLVLVLEDLHWSDYSTLDLISYLARQRQPTQLMLIGTYRPVDLILSGHPLKAVKQELFAKGQCEELPLSYLAESSVADYLSHRFPAHRFPPGLAQLIHERTEGNPLFMVNTVDYLAANDLIVESNGNWQLAGEIERIQVGVPDTIKQMIEKQIEHLDVETQSILEGASVAGAEFSTSALAAGLAEDRALLESRCDELARQHQFLLDRGIQILPTGEPAPRYGFIHALYQNVLYERVPPAKRVRLHRRIAERGEEVYGERAGEIAAELAMHFERGSKYEQAVKYLNQAAGNALRRFAYREAVTLARRGLDLLQKIPDSTERVEQELSLHITLGVPLIATEGYAASVVGDVYSKARELCRRLGRTPHISESLWGLWTFHTLRAELGIAREIAAEFLVESKRFSCSGLGLRGHWAMEIAFMHLGEFELALDHYEQALALYNPQLHLDDAFSYAQNPGVAMRCFAACARWFLGQPEQAARLIEEALNTARDLAEPHGLAHALFFAALLHQLAGDSTLAAQRAEEAISVSNEHGLVTYQAMAGILLGWTAIEQQRPEAASEKIREGLAALKATNTELLRPHFMTLLAEALSQSGQLGEALSTIEEALEIVRCNGEASYLAETYRIKGEILLSSSTSDGATDPSISREHDAVLDPAQIAQAEACFRQALEIARNQNAKALELRAMMSLARLPQMQGTAESTWQSLEKLYHSFTEGFETRDLLDARTMLNGHWPLTGAQSSRS